MVRCRSYSSGLDFQVKAAVMVKYSSWVKGSFRSKSTGLRLWVKAEGYG